MHNLVMLPAKCSVPSGRRQYLLVDNKKHRRNSAPEYLGSGSSLQGSRILRSGEYWLRASTSDLSVLLDNQSESGSSLELDTSNLSRDLSPARTVRDNMSDFSRGSYQNVPIVHFEVYRCSVSERSGWHVACSWIAWKIVLLSQAMAGCLTVMDLSGEIASDRGDQVVGLRYFLTYAFLCTLWTNKLAYRNDGRGILQVVRLSGLRYVLLSVLHVEANFLLFSSLQQTTYMGNQTTDLVAASLSLVLAYVCFEVQFQLTHINGFAAGVLGGVGFCLANVFSKQGEEEICWGDILRIGSGIFLALNNLAQELIVKSIDSVEYLGMMGFAGSLISGLQTIVLERDVIVSGNCEYWLSVVTFSIVQCMLNCLSPRLLRDVGAAGMHLALISSEFYKHFARWLMGRNQFQSMYLASYVLVLLGSYLFSVKRTSIGTHYFFPVKVLIPKGN